jgi:putative membrane protein
MWCAARRKDFVGANNTRSGRDFRIMNEVPTLLMIVIILSVIIKF